MAYHEPSLTYTGNCGTCTVYNCPTNIGVYASTKEEFDLNVATGDWCLNTIATGVKQHSSIASITYKDWDYNIPTNESIAARLGVGEPYTYYNDDDSPDRMLEHHVGTIAISGEIYRGNGWGDSCGTLYTVQDMYWKYWNNNNNDNGIHWGNWTVFYIYTIDIHTYVPCTAGSWECPDCYEPFNGVCVFNENLPGCSTKQSNLSVCGPISIDFLCTGTGTPPIHPPEIPPDIGYPIGDILCCDYVPKDFIDWSYGLGIKKLISPNER